MADDDTRTPDGPNKAKKIIVDEDWKSQVEAEREAMDEQEAEAPSEPRHGPLPPASLSMLITQLATQASLGLGDIADPTTGKPEPDPELAKHCIDMLEVLGQKTQGNTEPSEKQLLDTVLFQLRMRYVSFNQGPAS